MVRVAFPPLDPARRAGARAAIAPLSARLGMAARTAPYLPLRADGDEPPGLPTLNLEDISEIPFVQDVPGIEAYQHRARVRAGDGDLFVAVTPAAPGYEAYCQGLLGLGRPEGIVARPDPDDLLAVASACLQPEVFGRLVERAAEAGGLIIHPYMAIEGVWTLARRLEEAARAPVRVIGPPPPVLWLANDKNLLSETVAAILGDTWLVETCEARTPEAMADRLAWLATRHPRVGLKRTRCASAMGNAVFDAGQVRAGALGLVWAFLDRTRWPEGEDVLAVAWEETDLSPSTQLWIPAQGPPVVEGIYEQLLEGPEKVFLGSRPSTLPEAINGALAEASQAVAEAFQAMGYVGRCSFDFIVVGDVHDRPRILFTECNGRWGGTSTPMHLVDRLRGAPRPHYVAQDIMDPRLVGVTLGEILARVGDEAYDARTGRGRFVFYNVGPLANKGKLDVIALGETPDDAQEALKARLPALLGLGPR